MPHDEYEWIEKKEILTFEEITRLGRLFVGLGVNKIRLTGGEPLMRRNLELLIAQLSGIEGISDICVTTNGSLLADKVEAFKAAGLKRLNVSVDTLNPRKFKEICKRDDLDKVLQGLFAAKRCGFDPIKINAVVERGVNDDDILELVEFAREHGFVMRFIEYMDVGNTNSWTSEKLVSKKEIVEKVNARFPLKEVGRENGSAPAVDYEFADGRGEVGVVASVTEPFCASCNRARLTADGKLVTCLFSSIGHDLKALLRGGSSNEEILGFITSIWQGRKDRYSSERLEALQSSTYDPKSRKKIEMITLGG
jgi:cyclic pyranopterin phosphate synthase